MEKSMKSIIPQNKIFLLVFILLVVVVIMVSNSTYIAFANERLHRIVQSPSGVNNKSGLVSARENSVQWNSAPRAWSRSRMEAAQPYPLPEIESFPNPPDHSMRLNTNPEFIPGVIPTENQPGEPTAVVDNFQEIQTDPSFDYPAPFTRYANFDKYTTYPYRTIGVLFFTQRGIDSRCSAAVVGKNILWTAGHCLHDGSGEPEGWSYDVVFVPSYEDGNAPFGNWSYYDLVVRTSWFTSADKRFDFGGVILKQNDDGKSIQEIVGRLGIAFNLDPIQHWFNFGYPVFSPFDGKSMQICAGSFARNDISFTAPIPQAMGCDMTPGSSGGPWIINFSGSTVNTNYLNGNNSYRLTNFDEEIYSPYFGDDARDLYYFISTESEVLFPFITSSGDQ
jgi:V8-like Glu-specific endopeptidase